MAKSLGGPHHDAKTGGIPPGCSTDDARSRGIGAMIEASMDRRREKLPPATPNPILYPEARVNDGPYNPDLDGERRAQPVTRRVEYPAHNDPDLEFLLALEAVIEQAVASGASRTQVLACLDYARSRPRRYPHFDDMPDQAWPDENELPPGPYRNPEDTI